MLLLTASDVRRVFGMAEAFQGVARAALAHVHGRVQAPARSSLRFVAHPGEVLVMPAIVDDEAFAVKLWHRFAASARHGATIQLLDARTGRTVLMDADAVTDLRTGAMSGLAARYLAAEDASTAGVIGAGAQARTQVLALLHALPGLRTIRIVSRAPERASAFAAALRHELDLAHPGRPIDVHAVGSVADAAAGAAVVVAATTAKDVVLPADLIEPGTLVCGVGSHTADATELDPELLARASVVVVDTVQGAVAGSGELERALAGGQVRRSDLVELGRLIERGERLADPSRITVFKSVGFSAADVACAIGIARDAERLGLGVEVDLGA